VETLHPRDMEGEHKGGLGRFCSQSSDMPFLNAETSAGLISFGNASTSPISYF
jgi:hypothetical protein